MMFLVSLVSLFVWAFAIVVFVVWLAIAVAVKRAREARAAAAFPPPPPLPPPPPPVTPPVDSAAIFARLRGDLADPSLGKPRVEPHPGQRWTAGRRRDARDEQAQWQDLFDILSR